MLATCIVVQPAQSRGFDSHEGDLLVDMVAGRFVVLGSDATRPGLATTSTITLQQPRLRIKTC